MASAIALRQKAVRQFIDTLVVTAGLVLLWQLAFRYFGSSALAPPLETVIHTYGMLRSGDFWPNAYATVEALGIAMAIEIVIGPALGIFLGFNQTAADVFEPVLVSFYSVPKIIFYPIVLMVFGIGLTAKVVFAVLHGIVPIILFTLGAVRDIKPVYFKTARVMQLRPLEAGWRIALPAAIPEIFTGLRIGFASTMVGCLLSEMFGSRNGLGFMLMNAMALNVVNVIMSLTLLLVAFAAVVNGILLYIDGRLHRLG